jgi:hypothetical protein
MLSRRELARQATERGRKITEGGIRQAIKAGRVRVGVSNVEDLLSDLNNNTSFKKGGDAFSGKGLGTASPYAYVETETQNSKSPVNLGKEKVHSLAEANLVIAKIKAKSDLLDLQLKEGTLLDAESVRRASQEMGRAWREGLEGLPSKIAAQLAAETDVKKVFEILESSHRDLLNNICNDLSKL